MKKPQPIKNNPMSSTENPIHAPGLPPRHHLQKGDEKRIRLAGGPFVDSHTLADFTLWHRRGISQGIIIDRLTLHAKATGFDPVTNLVKNPLPAKGQKAGSR
jgi:hypothetical protein